MEEPDVLTQLRDALERLGTEVIATAEEVSSGRRPVLPDGVRASLADLVSGLGTLAEGAATTLQDWSRRLGSGDGGSTSP